MHDKVIWISDPHLLRSGEKLLGLDPERALVSAVTYIGKYHADALFCVVSGDLADDGAFETYKLFRHLMDRLQMPILSLPGNHDNRDTMRAVLEMPKAISGKTTMDYFVQFGGGSIIFLDTKKQNSDGGFLGPDQIAWLGETLESLNGNCAYIFMHHPPLQLGLPMQDIDWLENSSEFLSCVGQHKNVKHLFFGHVHRAVSGSLAGLPFTGMGSSLFQAPLPYPSWTWDNFRPAEEPACIGIVLIGNGNVVVHFHLLTGETK